VRRALIPLLLVALTAAAAPDPEASAPPPSAAAAPDTPFKGKCEAVTIEPTKTSIYIGSVTLTVPPFAWRGGTYSSTYAADVFPFFFYNEKGTVSIELSADDLRRLLSGERVFFRGSALTTTGSPRRIEGHATPDGPNADRGRIKVRIWVSKRIELIFNTTYLFSGKG